MAMLGPSPGERWADEELSTDISCEGEEIVSLIVTKSGLSKVSPSSQPLWLSVFTLCSVWFQNLWESPTVPSVCFFQSFYKLNANIHRGT